MRGLLKLDPPDCDEKNPPQIEILNELITYQGNYRDFFKYYGSGHIETHSETEISKRDKKAKQKSDMMGV